MSGSRSSTWPGGSTGTRTVIAVGAKPPEFSGRGVYVDGKSPLARQVELSFDDAARVLRVSLPGGPAQEWAYDDLRALRDQAGDDSMLLGKAGGDPARIEVNAPDAALIRTRATRLHRRVATVHRGKLAALALGAVASVALMILVLVPFMANRLADFLPPEGEAALGQATLGQIRNVLDDSGVGRGVGLCEGPDGMAALAALTARLTDQAEGLRAPITVHVLDHDMINAFALPGGNVVLFRGLIEAAESPDEIAAVMAHEIGHVVARDPTRTALQSAGSIGVLGLLFGDFAGGAMVLFLAERIIQADHTQAAEAAADAYGADLLVRVGIPPAALAEFFTRLQDSGGEPPAIVQHFLSHPALDDRIAVARSIPPGDAPQVPALGPEGWAALRTICN